MGKAVQVFGFGNHPVMTALQDEVLLKGYAGKPRVTYAAMIQMFYRTDSFTMFNTNIDAKTAIKQQSEKVGAELKAALVDPLAQARLQDATPERKCEGNGVFKPLLEPVGGFRSETAVT